MLREESRFWHRVIACTADHGPDGRQLGKWATPSPGEFYMNPRLSVLPDGRAALLHGARVHLLGLRIWDEQVYYEEGTGGIAATQDGLVIIADHSNRALKAFTPEGELRWSLTLAEGLGAVQNVRLVADGNGDLWGVGGSLVVRYTLRRNGGGRYSGAPQQ